MNDLRDRLHKLRADAADFAVMSRQASDAEKRELFGRLADELAIEALELEQLVKVHIDPMSAYVGVGKVNSSSTTDVRGFLTPLKELAEETGVFILGIMHFNKKADVTNAMLRIADSLAYVAAARSVFVVVDDPEIKNQRLFVKAKNNLAPDKKALSYMTGIKKTGVDEDTRKEIWAPHIIWGAKHVEITATEAMQAEAGGGGAKRAKDEAKGFLLGQLAQGPKKQTEIEEEAEQSGLSKRTLARAKKDLGIKSKKLGKDEGWEWSLPPADKYFSEKDD